jgi:hypothetical protein
MLFIFFLDIIEGGKELLVSNGIDDLLEKMKNHPEQIIKSKAEETQELLATI